MQREDELGRFGVFDTTVGNRPVQIRVVASDETKSADEGSMSSVGREQPDLSAAMETIREAADVVHAKLAHLRPSKTTVEFGVSFTVKSGHLTALLFDGKADAALTISLEWEGGARAPAPESPASSS